VIICAKTAELIEMLFGLGQIPHVNGQLLGKGHAWASPFHNDTLP